MALKVSGGGKVLIRQKMRIKILSGKGDVGEDGDAVVRQERSTEMLSQITSAFKTRYT